MIQRSFLTSAILLLATLPTNEASAQCAGSATAATTYTQHFNCSSPGDALQWTLNIACLNGCGEVWWNIPPKDGAADGACDQYIRNFCSPKWYRYSYTNGMYAETSAFEAYLFAGCKHRDLPITTAGDCPCAPDCGGEPDRPPERCSVTPEVSTSTLVLSGTGSADLTALPSGFFSERREVVDGVSFIMEDWAVARVTAKESGSVRLLSVEGSSSTLLAPGPGTPVLSMRPAALGSNEPSAIALVIEKPVHPDNSRMIPIPRVELVPAALPYLGERVTAAVRIDLGEDRKIRESRVLYSTGPVPEGLDLAEHLRSHLRLRYASEKRHRVIVYGIVEVEAGRATLRDSEVVLPLCCCNPFCI
jgi:hypothetical protein